MQGHVVRRDTPADALHLLLHCRQRAARLLKQQGDAVAIPTNRDRAGVAGLYVDEVELPVKLAILPLQHADVTPYTCVVSDAVIATKRNDSRKTVAYTFNGVIAIGVGAAFLVL